MTCPMPTLTGGGSRFIWRGHEVNLAVPGAHNALNAAAALEAASLAGAEPERAIAGLAGFTGAGRRFQRVGATARGGAVYEDYAHHPTEVAATLRRGAHARAPAAGGGVPAPPLLAHRAARARVRSGAGARRRCGRARRLPGTRARRGLPGGERADDRAGRRGRRARAHGDVAADVRRCAARPARPARRGRPLHGDGRRRRRRAGAPSGGGCRRRGGARARFGERDAGP